MKRKTFGCLLVLLGVLFCLADCSATYQRVDEDPLSGASWIADNDGSQWVFREDGSFSWYQNKEVTEDNYYAGDYTVKRGAAAVNYLVEDLSEFGYTREGIENIISTNESFDDDYNLNNFICYSCDNKSYMLNGQEQLTGEWLTAYYGFILEDESRLVVMNVRTGSYYGFSKEESLK